MRQCIEIIRQFRAAGIGVTLWRDNVACCQGHDPEGAIHIALQNSIPGRDGEQQAVGFYRPEDIARLRVVLDVVEDILRSDSRLAVAEPIEQIEGAPLVVEWDLRGKAGGA